MGAHLPKALIFMAAFGAALSGCAPIKYPEMAAAPPPVVAPPPQKVAIVPRAWRVRKTEWTQADEDGFGQFVRAIAESGCATTVSCMQSAANPYHDSDPQSLAIHADCAKWAYMLRAYYASKNGLPFSYVSRIYSPGSDPRFSARPNEVVERRDIVDNGAAIDADAVLKRLHDEVSSATYRMDPALQVPLPQDFYSPKIEPGAIRAGTVIYDINGHVMIVYDVTPDGSILYMDANPDQTVSRGNYGPQVPRSEISLGGGFKNFRPLKLEGAQIQPDGTYLGGHIVLAANDAIPDFSLEQYRGNDAKANNLHTDFRYNDASLNLYQYARASMSRGGFAFNPVYELEVSMGTLCHDAIGHTRGVDERIEQGVATLYTDLSKSVAQRMQGDLRVVYNALTLKDALTDAYDAQDHACVAAAGSGSSSSPLDPYMHQSPQTDVQGLIAQIVEPASLSQMRPVGH